MRRSTTRKGLHVNREEETQPSCKAMAMGNWGNLHSINLARGSGGCSVWKRPKSNFKVQNDCHLCGNFAFTPSPVLLVYISPSRSCELLNAKFYSNAEGRREEEKSKRTSRKGEKREKVAVTCRRAWNKNFPFINGENAFLWYPELNTLQNTLTHPPPLGLSFPVSWKSYGWSYSFCARSNWMVALRPREFWFPYPSGWSWE